MVYAFGEILWDIFGDTRSIGGAPFNFAAHFASLGGAAALISAVGEDLLGDEALRAMRSFGVSERLVQRIAERPTALVPSRSTRRRSAVPACVRNRF